MKLQAQVQDGSKWLTFEVQDMNTNVINDIFYIDNSTMPLLYSTIKPAPKDEEIHDLMVAIKINLFPIAGAIENALKKLNNPSESDIKWLTDSKENIHKIWAMIGQMRDLSIINLTHVK